MGSEHHAKSRPTPPDYELLAMVEETNKKTAETRKELNPPEAVAEVLAELRKLEDEEKDKLWELVEVNQ